MSELYNKKIKTLISPTFKTIWDNNQTTLNKMTYVATKIPNFNYHQSWIAKKYVEHRVMNISLDDSKLSFLNDQLQIGEYSFYTDTDFNNGTVKNRNFNINDMGLIKDKFTTDYPDTYPLKHYIMWNRVLHTIYKFTELCKSNNIKTILNSVLLDEITINDYLNNSEYKAEFPAYNHTDSQTAKHAANIFLALFFKELNSQYQIFSIPEEETLNEESQPINNQEKLISDNTSNHNLNNQMPSDSNQQPHISNDNAKSSFTFFSQTSLKAFTYLMIIIIIGIVFFNI